MRIRDGWFLIDLGEADEEAVPFGDPFHYLVQAPAFLGLADAPDAFAADLRTTGHRLHPEQPDGERCSDALRRLRADVASTR